METLTVLLVVIHLVTCRKTPNDLKVEYFVKTINNALEEAEEYQPRKNNSDLLATDENASPIGLTKGFTFIFYCVYVHFVTIFVAKYPIYMEFWRIRFHSSWFGSSGSAFAAKMSEIAEFKILLLEAGDFDDDLTKIPYLSTLFQKSDRNWGYFSSPQKNACFGKIHSVCRYVRNRDICVALLQTSYFVCSTAIT
ncbi:hypothetical protein WA026_009990 [Henosepilachna vigintioctopunctata]|uniref:Uncharacterized protein n=1 Tax=Henosepilachna vigintioctopunctata TaxID=420089 RepID=A0AAW1TJD3_9CUCU